MGVTRGWLGYLLLIWGQRLGAWRLSISYCYIDPHMGDRGGEVCSLMCSLHKAITLMTPHAVTNICPWNEIKLATQLPTTEAHLWGVFDPSWYRAHWCLPPVWRWHGTECHHLLSVPEHIYGWGVLLCHLEYDHGPLKWSQWMWWTFWGKAYT